MIERVIILYIEPTIMEKAKNLVCFYGNRGQHTYLEGDKWGGHDGEGDEPDTITTTTIVEPENWCRGRHPGGGNRWYTAHSLHDRYLPPKVALKRQYVWQDIWPSPLFNFGIKR